MIQKIKGIIAGASSVKRFIKKDGTESHSAILHIKEVCNEEHPNEIAVKVTGEKTNYAGCTGMLVEVEYVNRVFEFKDKENSGKSYGNDVFALSIQILNDDRSAMLDSNVKEV